MQARADLETVAASYAGTWRFYDDGWPGRLTLTPLVDNRLEGTFYSDRFRAEYLATAIVSDDEPRRLTITLHEYNWLDKQNYFGFILSSDLDTIAGYSYWRSERYGFIAFQERSVIPGNFRPGPVEPMDFEGDWALSLDGRVYDVELECSRSTGSLLGVWATESTRGKLTCELTDSRAGHAIRLTGAPTENSNHGSAGLDGASMDGYLFTRPKSAIAGHGDVKGTTVGFYLLRQR